MLGNIYAVHNDETFWESPAEFIPDRFLSQCEGVSPAAMSSPGYMPFGVGVRSCAGDRFALSAIWLYVVMILHRFHLEPTARGSRLSEEETWGLHVTPKQYSLEVTRRT